MSSIQDITPEDQKVLVIQDASRKLCTEAFLHALNQLPINAGDNIKFLGVVPLKTPNTIMPLIGCIVPRKEVHSSATIKKKQEVVQREVQKKLDEYLKTPVIMRAMRVASSREIEFEVAVEAGVLKDVATNNAAKFQPTWLILDRHLKKDEKYFLDNFSCGILRMKRDDRIKCIREYRAGEPPMNPPQRGQTSNNPNPGSYLREKQQKIHGSTLCSICQYTRPETKHIKDFTYSELQFATNSFSEENLLSNHGSITYRGTLRDGKQIVIRELPSATIKKDEFKAQVQMLKIVKHENVMMLLGSCSEEHHRLLVYEFVCNGSLDRLLSDRSGYLTLESRMKIALGVAKGLEYLHKEKIFGNIRPNNILITHDHRPLLANFGLVRYRYEGLSSSSETTVLKTCEYLAPEYAERGIDWSKADVYSFGVVLLELITGRKTIQETKGQSFLRWARPLLQQKAYHELIDPTLPDSPNLYQLHHMVRVADECLSWDPKSRLSVDKVVMALECVIQGCSMQDFNPNESESNEVALSH